jgi:hypothetical protein
MLHPEKQHWIYLKKDMLMAKLTKKNSKREKQNGKDELNNGTL